VKEKRTSPSSTKPGGVKRAKLTSSDFILKSQQNQANSFKMSSLGDNNSVIAKLCNINHGNLEACKDPDRQFLPSLKEFFEEAIEQQDPANQVEKQYALITQTDWAWKALRLLAKRSTYYFMQNQNVRPISDYLELICTKLGKELANDQAKQDQQLAQQQTTQLQKQQPQSQPQQVLTAQEPSDQQTTNVAISAGVSVKEEKPDDSNSTLKADESENVTQMNDDDETFVIRPSGEEASSAKEQVQL
jgi:hypothetical protein